MLKVFLRAQYHEQLEAQGGSAPYTWKLDHGDLPHGLSLDRAGVLSGMPSETGDFHIVITVSDSANPAHQRNQELTLRVLAPLAVQWGNQAKINGKRIEGSVKVSNQTGDDFDLTFVVLAVNDLGRATAIGYQHFNLKHETLDYEIPFGENLPPGGYVVNVDVVAEIATTNSIHRARLVTPGKLQMVQGP
ncbi:MAG TPA: putative Ig domain-containing protein [Terriglobales bacterium]|nr:putative Ig domain-containing protein [Terriglobales bacterium]